MQDWDGALGFENRIGIGELDVGFGNQNRDWGLRIGMGNQDWG